MTESCGSFAQWSAILDFRSTSRPFCRVQVSWEPKMFLRLGVRALGKLPSHLLKGGERHPAPLR
jgi:hypothetical protein